MLALVTLVVVAGFNLGTSNLKLVYNVQTRDEAVSATQIALEQVISSNFTAGRLSTPPAPLAAIAVDIDGNGVNDYQVSFSSSSPVCVRRALASGAAPSDVELGTTMSTSSFWNTDWEIEAIVNDSNTGAKVTVREAVRLRQSGEQARLVCPNADGS